MSDRRPIFAAVLSAALLLIAGCDPRPPQQIATLVPAPNLDQIDLLSDTSGELVDESWSVHCVRGFKLGHRWQRTYAATLGESPVQRTIVVDELLIPRFSSLQPQILRSATLTRDDGTVLEMQYELQSAEQRRRLVAKVAGDRLYLMRSSGTQRQTSDAAWDPANGGFFAIERSLSDNPLAAGQQRTVQVWLPLVDQAQSMRLTARSPTLVSDSDPAVGWPVSDEPSSDGRVPASGCDLAQPEMPLTRIDIELADSAQPTAAQMAVWTDQEGVIQRYWRRALDQTTVRSTQLAALAPNEPLRFDVALDVRVPMADAPPDIQTARTATYRIRSTRGQRRPSLPQSVYQRVTPLDGSSVQVTVRTDLSAGDPVARQATDPAPRAADVQPNYWLESTAPAIVNFVKPLRRLEDSRAQQVERLRAAVHGRLREVALGSGLATAAAALESKTGDCTEHAMLLAAACRACQIPARIAVGLVYDQRQAAFVFHMWTDVWNGTAWQPLDAMSDSPIPAANRIKILQADLSDQFDYGLIAPVLQVIDDGWEVEERRPEASVSEAGVSVFR